MTALCLVIFWPWSVDKDIVAFSVSRMFFRDLIYPVLLVLKYILGKRGVACNTVILILSVIPIHIDSFFNAVTLPRKRKETSVCLKCLTYNLKDDVEILCTVCELTFFFFQFSTYSLSHNVFVIYKAAFNGAAVKEAELNLQHRLLCMRWFWLHSCHFHSELKTSIKGKWSKSVLCNVLPMCEICNQQGWHINKNC